MSSGMSSLNPSLHPYNAVSPSDYVQGFAYLRNTAILAVFQEYTIRYYDFNTGNVIWIDPIWNNQLFETSKPILSTNYTNAQDFMATGFNSNQFVIISPHKVFLKDYYVFSMYLTNSTLSVSEFGLGEFIVISSSIDQYFLQRKPWHSTWDYWNGPWDSNWLTWPPNRQLIGNRCLVVTCHAYCSSCFGPTVSEWFGCFPNVNIIYKPVTFTWADSRWLGEWVAWDIVQEVNTTEQVLNETDNTMYEVFTIITEYSNTWTSWDFGYYKDANNNCIIWDTRCRTWNGPGPNDCLTCNIGQQPYQGSWITWHSTWKVCNGETIDDCTKWFGTDFLHINGAIQRWFTWDFSWLTWNGNTEYDWLTCTNIYLTPTGNPNGTWIWEDSWETWDGPTIDDCLIWNNKTLYNYEGTCIKWYETWDGCRGTAANQCINWTVPYILAPDFTWNLYSNVCNPLCLECFGPDNGNWFNWTRADNYLTGDYFCLPCHSSWSTWDEQHSYSWTSCNPSKRAFLNKRCYDCVEIVDYSKNYIEWTSSPEVRFLTWTADITPQDKQFYISRQEFNITVRLVDASLITFPEMNGKLGNNYLQKFTVQNAENSEFVKFQVTGSSLIVILSKKVDEGAKITFIVKSLNEDNLIYEENSKQMRFTKNTATVSYYVPVTTQIATSLTASSQAVADLMKSATPVLGGASMAGSAWSFNLGASMVKLFQIIDIFGKLYFVPIKFHDNLDFYLGLINQLSDFIEVSSSLIIKNPVDNERSVYYRKLTTLKQERNIYRSIPLFAPLYMALRFLDILVSRVIMRKVLPVNKWTIKFSNFFTKFAYFFLQMSLADFAFYWSYGLMGIFTYDTKYTTLRMLNWVTWIYLLMEWANEWYNVFSACHYYLIRVKEEKQNRYSKYLEQVREGIQPAKLEIYSVRMLNPLFILRQIVTCVIITGLQTSPGECCALLILFNGVLTGHMFYTLIKKRPFESWLVVFQRVSQELAMTFFFISLIVNYIAFAGVTIPDLTTSIVDGSIIIMILVCIVLEIVGLLWSMISPLLFWIIKFIKKHRKFVVKKSKRTGNNEDEEHKLDIHSRRVMVASHTNGKSLNKKANEKIFHKKKAEREKMERELEEEFKREAGDNQLKLEDNNTQLHKMFGIEPAENTVNTEMAKIQNGSRIRAKPQRIGWMLKPSIKTDKNNIKIQKLYHHFKKLEPRKKSISVKKLDEQKIIEEPDSDSPESLDISKSLSKIEESPKETLELKQANTRKMKKANNMFLYNAHEVSKNAHSSRNPNQINAARKFMVNQKNQKKLGGIINIKHNSNVDNNIEPNFPLSHSTSGYNITKKSKKNLSVNVNSIRGLDNPNKIKSSVFSNNVEVNRVYDNIKNDDPLDKKDNKEQEDPSIPRNLKGRKIDSANNRASHPNSKLLSDQLVLNMPEMFDNEEHSDGDINQCKAKHNLNKDEDWNIDSLDQAETKNDTANLKKEFDAHLESIKNAQNNQKTNSNDKNIVKKQSAKPKSKSKGKGKAEMLQK